MLALQHLDCQFQRCQYEDGRLTDAQGRKVDQWSGPIGLPQLLARIAKVLPA